MQGNTLDHLVVMADSLEQGESWCERVLGLRPDPGGRHALFGTHNSLLAVAGPGFERAYLEIIAMDPEHAPQQGRRRWFDMDDAELRQQVRDQGPRLIHWVARCPDVTVAVAALARLGLERGPVLQASRQTPHGLLQWGISVRDDGQRLMQGCLPTLIQWGDVHPCDRMPDRGLRLQSLRLQHPEADRLHQALLAAGLPARLAQDGQIHSGAGLWVQPAEQAALQAVLQTPTGEVMLA